MDFTKGRRRHLLWATWLVTLAALADSSPNLAAPMPRFPGGAAISFRLLGKAGSGVSGKRISTLAEEVIAECADKGLRPGTVHGRYTPTPYACPACRTIRTDACTVQYCQYVNTLQQDKFCFWTRLWRSEAAGLGFITPQRSQYEVQHLSAP